MIQNEFGKVFMGNLMTFGSSSLTISTKKVLVFCHIVIVVVVFDKTAFIGIFRKEPGIKNIVLDAAMFCFKTFIINNYPSIKLKSIIIIFLFCPKVGCNLIKTILIIIFVFKRGGITLGVNTTSGSNQGS